MAEGLPTFLAYSCSIYTLQDAMRAHRLYSHIQDRSRKHGTFDTSFARRAPCYVLGGGLVREGAQAQHDARNDRLHVDDSKL